MSDEIFHQAPTAPAAESAAVVQPSTEVIQQDNAEGTGASEQVAETEQQAAERIVQERRVRQQRAAKNQEAAFRRLADKNDALTAALMDAVRKGTPQQAPVADNTDKAPRREDFETWEAYEDARVDWRVETKARQANEKQVRELAQLLERSQREQQQTSLITQHAQRNAEFAKYVPDFADVTDRPDVEVPGPASEAIMELPNSPAVLYAIGKDPSLAEAMHGMRPFQQAAFVGQISAALMQRSPQVSQAPPPGTPVGSRSSAPLTLETATKYEDFVRIRRNQIAQKRR